MVENGTFSFHRSAPNRWNVDVPSVYGNALGLTLCVQPWCPHLSWSMTQPPLKNQVSALPPASATGSANPAHVLVVHFESERPLWKPARVKLVQVKAESVSQIGPALVTHSTARSAEVPAEMWCWACNACCSSALCGFQLFGRGADSEQWKGEKAEIILAHKRKLMFLCPVSKTSPSAKN